MYAHDGDFQDDSDSPFTQAVGLTPQETWEQSIAALNVLLIDIDAAFLAAQREGAVGVPSMTRQRLHDIHQSIFIRTFPADAGRQRAGNREFPEVVTFGVLIGTIKSAVARPFMGTSPRRLSRVLDEICAQFNASMAGLAARQRQPPDPREVIEPCARLYLRLLRAHPWLDGNQRAAFVALNACLRESGLRMVRFADLAEHDEALGYAFKGRCDFSAPMVEAIAEALNI